jgi:AAA domain
MTFDLSSVTANHAPLPPRIVIYGAHGVGKTTFGASAPHPIFIRTEDGLGTLQVPAFPLAKNYQHILDAMRALYSGEHLYRTVVIDSLDWLEPLVWARTALEKGKESVEDFGYGKGYVYAEEFWDKLLEGLNHLRAKGMTVICLAHAEIKRFDAPDTEPYDRYQIKLHKLASALVQEWADIIGFAHYEIHTQKTETGFNKKIVRGVGTGNRLLAVVERPAFVAKNRYGISEEIPFSWSALSNALAPAFTHQPTDLPTEEAAHA